MSAPAPTGAMLRRKFAVLTSTVVETQRSEDGTVKLLVRYLLFWHRLFCLLSCLLVGATCWCGWANSCAVAFSVVFLELAFSFSCSCVRLFLCALFACFMSLRQLVCYLLFVVPFLLLCSALCLVLALVSLLVLFRQLKAPSFPANHVFSVCSNTAPEDSCKHITAVCTLLCALSIWLFCLEHTMTPFRGSAFRKYGRTV